MVAVVAIEINQASPVKRASWPLAPHAWHEPRVTGVRVSSRFSFLKVVQIRHHETVSRSCLKLCFKSNYK